MKTVILTFLATLLLAGSAPAQMIMKDGGMSDMQGMQAMAMGMGPAAMAEVVGPDLMAACQTDLGPLGLSAEVRASIEDKRFELRKAAIRTVADLQVLRLELGRLIERRDFDPAAAKKVIEEMSGKEAALRASHVEFLSFVGSRLTEEQWQKLRRRGRAAMPGMQDGAMAMMGGEGGMMAGMEGDMAAPPKEGPSKGATSGKTQEKEEAGVTVKVTSRGGEATLQFQVSLDTHSVDLGAYRFDEVVVLRAGGKEYRPRVLSEEAQGHHRAATVEFDNPGARKMEIIVRGVAGVAERVFPF